METFDSKLPIRNRGVKAAFTENALADIFEQILTEKNILDGNSTFRFLSKEIDCQQGRPDFIASPDNFASLSEMRRNALSEALIKPSSAKLLSLMSYKVAASLDILREMSGYTKPTIRNSILLLQNAELVQSLGDDQYFLSPSVPELELEFWAFEIKLSNWKRALFQALQYRAFAQYTVVVLPEQSVHLAEKHVDQFENLGIGIIAVDIVARSTRFIAKPKKKNPSSRFHYYYALGQILHRQMRLDVE